MSKRGLQETSPDQFNREKRRPSESYIEPEMETNNITGISIDQLKEILAEKNKELSKELVTKADFKLLYAELSELKIEHKAIAAKVVELEKRNRLLETQVDRLLQKNTESNVVVRLPAESDTDPIEKAKSVCAGILDKTEENLDVESAYKAPSRDSRKATIILKFKSLNTAVQLIQNSRKLRGTKISVSRDFPRNIRQRRSKLVPIMKALREKTPPSVAKIYLLGDKLYVGNKIFTWDPSEGLKCGIENGFGVISDIYGELPACVKLMNELKKQNSAYDLLKSLPTDISKSRAQTDAPSTSRTEDERIHTLS